MVPPFATVPPAALVRNHPGLEQPLEQAVALVRPDFHMGWDLFLALLPLALAVILFSRAHLRTAWLWWLLWGCFTAFLPNAPYVLTDVIHFVEKIRVTPPLPLWAMSLLLLEFFLYFSVGLQSFTLSLMLWGGLLKRRGFAWLVLPVELLMITLSAFGMYLGRVDRLNSWNLLTRPGQVVDTALLDLHRQRSEEITLLFLGALLLLYYVMKGLNTFVLRLFSQSVSPHQAAHRGNEFATFDLKPLTPGVTHPPPGSPHGNGAS